MNHILQLASTSPDVVKFKMYYKLDSATEPLDQNSPFIELPVTDTLRYDLRDIPAMQSFDGIYKVAFSAVDDGNLEGPLGQPHVVTFDFVAPNPPTAVFSDN